MIKLELSEQEAYTLSTLLTLDVLVNRDNIFKATGDLSVLEEVNKKLDIAIARGTAQNLIEELSATIQKTHDYDKINDAKNIIIDAIEALQEQSNPKRHKHATLHH